MNTNRYIVNTNRYIVNTNRYIVNIHVLYFSPEILRDDIKVFFVKYNDPIYVKLEKLDVMIRLCTTQNIASILSELKE